MHLIGMQKLTDIQLHRVKAKELYQMALDGRLSCSKISRSAFYPDIEERLSLLLSLETALDTEELLIRWCPRLSGSRIKAAYLITYPVGQTLLHYFVDRDQDGENRYFGTSLFGRGDNAYMQGQQVFKVLKKEKVDTRDGSALILLDKLAVRSHLPQQGGHADGDQRNN